MTLKKDFWLELQDLFGRTSLKWGVRGGGLGGGLIGWDFNFIRRIFEKLGVPKMTPYMRDFDEFMQVSELIYLPLRNASFT